MSANDEGLEVTAEGRVVTWMLELRERLSAVERWQVNHESRHPR